MQPGAYKECYPRQEDTASIALWAQGSYRPMTGVLIDKTAVYAYVHESANEPVSGLVPILEQPLGWRILDVRFIGKKPVW